MILFDLDGTIADDAHRVHLIKKTKRGTAPWKKYNALCFADTPIRPVALLLNLLRWHTRCAIWSARCESTRETTVDWLSRHVFINGPGSATWNNPQALGHVPLRLRAVDDHRSSIALKSEWAESWNGEPIELVFEDHAEIAAMWRARGIRVALLDSKDYNDE